MKDFSVIITAGGIGKRMGGDLPKQFIEVAGKPILLHTISIFYKYNSGAQIIVTLPEDWKDYWNDLLKKHNFKIPHTIVSGGEERFHSIKNALEACKSPHVFVHDGVRPLVAVETLNRCSEALQFHKAVIPVVGMKESIRWVEGSQSKALKRSEYRIVQTPQCFERELLVQAYNQPFHEGITDDASLVEELGQRIECVEGNDENIKVTTPTDLIIAEGLLK